MQYAQRIVKIIFHNLITLKYTLTDTKAQCELYSLFNCAIEILLLTYLEESSHCQQDC